MLCIPQRYKFFPYTTLFRSIFCAAQRLLPAIEQWVGGFHTLRARLRAITFRAPLDRKSTRLNSSHANISYAVFCLKKNIVIIQILTLVVYRLRDCNESTAHV